MKSQPPDSSGFARLFSSDYLQARSRFTLAAEGLGIPCHRQSIPHPLAGPDGERLSLDYAWIGNPDAPRVLVTQSAVHGVEGFAGSAIQLDQMLERSGQTLPGELAVLHIHAVNPHGFLNCRRVNEDGVDLNRNFVDFSQALPANPDYDLLRTSLIPENLSDWERASKRLADYERDWGSTRFHQAVSGGQFNDPQGPFYGGAKPAWSREVLEGLFVDLKLASRQRIAVLDLHTGLGPYGYGELICDHPPGSEGVKMARRWYGANVAEPALGTSSSVPKLGLIDFAWQRAFGDRVCFLTLEFGTYPFAELMESLRRDHALHKSFSSQTEPGQLEQVRQSMMRHFNPPATDWQEAVISRSRQVIQMALDGLSSEELK
ncbi:MAG: M14 family metallopeptidase [Chromatiales bacterium]|nr:M14 family metallopeptidase [Chromatiales bacterium]